MKNKFKIGLVQMSMSEDVQANHVKACSRIREACKQGAEVVCLPELYSSQYFAQKADFNTFDLAEPVDSERQKEFLELSRELKAVLVIPFFERRASGVYHNSATVYDDGSLSGIYRKMHIPDDPGYHEKYYFAPGDLGFKKFTTQHADLSVLICWDQWYPEGARISSLLGSSVLFYPTAIGWHPSEKEKFGARQQEAWITVQRGHAIANGIYVAAVNRVGFEQPVKERDGIQFWGSSFVCDPQGVMLAQGSTDNEEILISEVDLEHQETIRRNWPFLRDRRIDAYQRILSRFIDEGK